MSTIYEMKKCLFMLFLIAADQITKFWAKECLEIPRKITNFFHLRFVENSGIAFSIPIPRVLLIFMTAFILVYLIYLFFCKNPRNYYKLPLVFIISGAFGNFIDRVFRGKVIDFLSFWDFPIFNLADVFVFFGVVIYIFMEIFPLPPQE